MKIFNDNKGFTFLEVMVALAVLSGVVVTLLVTLNHHLGAASEMNDVVTASMLGRMKAEEVSIYGVPSEMSGGFEEGSGRFTWSLSASDTEVEAVRRVEVVVNWEKDREVRLVSFVRRR